MSKETYFIENDGGSNNQLAALIPALLQRQGIDPTTLLAMSGGGFGGGMGERRRYRREGGMGERRSRITGRFIR